MPHATSKLDIYDSIYSSVGATLVIDALESAFMKLISLGGASPATRALKAATASITSQSALSMKGGTRSKTFPKTTNRGQTKMIVKTT